MEQVISAVRIHRLVSIFKSMFLLEFRDANNIDHQRHDQDLSSANANMGRMKKKKKESLKIIIGGGLDVPNTTIVKTNIDFLVDFFVFSFSKICSTCQSIVRRAEDSIHPEISSI